MDSTGNKIITQRKGRKPLYSNDRRIRQLCIATKLIGKLMNNKIDERVNNKENFSRSMYYASQFYSEEKTNKKQLATRKLAAKCTGLRGVVMSNEVPGVQGRS